MLELRPPREEEAGALAALMSVYSPEPVTEERVRRRWCVEKGFALVGAERLYANAGMHAAATFDIYERVP